MNNPSKKRIAQLLLCSLLLESCYNPNLGTGKKTLPAPAAPTYQQELHDKPPSLSLTPPDDHPRQPQAVARSQAQPRATTQPLPSPSREAPSTSPASLRKQNALLRSQKAAQAQRKQQIARAKPANEQPPTTQPRQAMPATPVQSSSPADQALLGIAHQDFLAQGGQQVRFRHQAGQWQAWVIERLGVFSRTALLPVVCQGHGDLEAALRALQAKPTQYVQHRLHVLRPQQVPYVPQLVYLGALGLRGGMDRAGGPSGSGEPQDELPSTALQDHEAAVAAAFFNAIRDHNVARVTDLLHQDRRLLEKVMERDNGQGALRERTPLMYAAQLGDTSMVSLLLEHGAAVDQANSDGRTPLMIATQEGHQAVVEYLIARGAAS